MAFQYVGKRPILRERNSTDNVHHWKGTVEKYSNYSIFNSSHVLEGAPLRHVEPGAGDYPHGLHLSRVFRGLEKNTPLDNPGEGPPVNGYGFRHLEHHGIPGDAPLKGSFGHSPGTSVYATGARYHQSPWQNDGVENEQILKGEFGHSLRATGGASTFGRFNPHNPNSRSVGEENPLEVDYGQALPAGNNGVYGRNRVNEWTGVPGDKAIF
jgi:hypothetical protein